MSTTHGTSSGTRKRRYEETHPWITFQLDLRDSRMGLWMNLGAAQSKCEHVANVMLPPDEAQELYELYLAKGIRATTAIEGNTLTEDEVLERIAKKKPLPKSREYLGREIDNIVSACDVIAQRIASDGDACKLTVEQIKEFNRMVLNGLKLDEGVVPGEVPNHEVVVGRYRGAPREDCEYLLQRMCDWINGMKPEQPQNRIAFGIIRAVMAHLYLAWIHPFGDGNGRTARLIEVQILIGAGVPDVAAHLLSNFYNQTRTEYYRQLADSSRAKDGVLSFLDYASQGIVDKLDLQIKRIRRYQRAIAWKDYVYEKFRSLRGPAAHRQRLLALQLRRPGKVSRWVSPARVRTLTSELALEYATKTRKTISRDLNLLVEMGLIIRNDRGQVAANIEALQTFLPRRRPEELRE